MKKLSTMLRSLVFSALMLFSVAAVPALAQTGVDVQKEFTQTLKGSGLITNSKLPEVETTFGNFIASVLALIGVATFALVVYAGGLWITAAGNEDKIAQAKRILTGAVLGLVVIFSAYILVNAALTALKQAVS